jgi:hypothetical protein
MVRDDTLRLILWAGVLAGMLLTAAALGDLRHLWCMFNAGIVLTVGSCLLILRWELQRCRAPAMQVVDITEAPSVALQAAENARRIDALEARADCHAIHIHGLYRMALDAINSDDRDSTQPIPKLSLAYPGRREGSAGLCAVAGLALVMRGRA